MIMHVSDFDLNIIRNCDILKRRAGNPKSRKRVRYLDLIAAFDIETTRLPEIEQSIMYVWQMQITPAFTVIGRTWGEFLTLLRQIADILKEKDDGFMCCMVVWVHNLSYEFQFLKGVYHFNNDDVFATAPRKVLKALMYDRIELRCSFLHSNMSLERYLQKWKVDTQKLSGTEFDYSKVRYPWTELTDKELAYCEHDVKGLCEALIAEMMADDDNLYSIPLTSTGYVRREAKRVMRKQPYGYIQRQVPNFDVYVRLRQAFRGGNTHANRFYAAETITDVHSYDRSSSYPDVLVNCRYPVTKFYKPDREKWDCEYICSLIDRDKAVLITAVFYNVSLINKFDGCPYIPRDKCRNIVKGAYDNGRVLSADQLEITLTDIDFRIIINQYNFSDMDCIDLYYARYGYLPEEYRSLIIKYYVNKTSLKGIDDYLYLKSKNLLNSLYGMQAQDPLKVPLIFDGCMFNYDDEADLKAILSISNQKAFLNYAWGVWCTAWARYRLQEGVELAGENFVYCDTDSVKYIGMVDWTAYNDTRIKDSIKSGAVATDPKGSAHYMGVYEPEETMPRFKTLGAKKYAYEDETGLHITIAGVSKKEGAAELAKKGGLDAMQEGFIFSESGKLEAVYNDDVNMSYEVDGNMLQITDNVVLRETTYTLGITNEYNDLIKAAHAYRLLRNQNKVDRMV